MRQTRRATLVALCGTVTLAGCSSTEAESGKTTQDSDGDGVPDEHDYAPDDPEVQSKSDLTGDGGSGDGGGGTTTDGGADGTTTTTTASSGVQNDGPDGDVTETSDSSDDQPGSNTDMTFPSHTGTHTITARDNYWAWEITMPGRFVLEYSVTNLLDENRDFDVLLYDQQRFREYRAIATEREEGIRPQYIDGSAPGVRTGARGTVELPAGTYYQVVDNTDLSDAGDWGTEETRRVRVEASTRAP